MNSYIVDCLEPQPGSFTSTLRADAHPHEHASSGWGGAPLYIHPVVWVILDVRCVTGFGQGGVRGQASSGKGGALQRRPPLRTVLAGFLAHGSSKPLGQGGLQLRG